MDDSLTLTQHVSFLFVSQTLQLSYSKDSTLLPKYNTALALLCYKSGPSQTSMGFSYVQISAGSKDGCETLVLCVWRRVERRGLWKLLGSLLSVRTADFFPSLPWAHTACHQGCDFAFDELGIYSHMKNYISPVNMIFFFSYSQQNYHCLLRPNPWQLIIFTFLKKIIFTFLKKIIVPCFIFLDFPLLPGHNSSLSLVISSLITYANSFLIFSDVNITESQGSGF